MMDKDKAYYQKRMEAAEAVLIKYRNILSNCPEFILWEQSLGKEPHFINRENKVVPVIPESMQKWMNDQNTVT